MQIGQVRQGEHQMALAVSDACESSARIRSGEPTRPMAIDLTPR
jgi:hypothetical protein